ncbi:MAG: cellulase family glycosylhydrolase [Chitinophagaceae bacterium]
MPPLKYRLLLLFVCLFTYNVSQSQGFLKTSGKQIVNEKGENVLLRGIGLGGWMLQEGYMLGLSNQWQQQNQIRKHIAMLAGEDKAQAFYDSWLANHTTKADVDSLKAWGFNSIRLPMHYNLYTLPVEKEPVAGGQTWLQKGFAMTDSLLAWCKVNKMYLILDMHAAPGGQGNDLNIADRDPLLPSLWQSEANRQKMIALWKKLAERYVNEPWIGAYDIINEPNWGFADTTNDRNGLKEKGNAPLRQLMMDITKAIREVDKKHIIIIEGNGWGNNYNGILPAWDNNMVMSFHKYWNYNTTQSVSHILKYRDENNIPVWLGETGENSNTWFTEAIRLFETNNIGWSWWPLKKLGNNNPLQIKNNKNYEQLLAYWNGKTTTPPNADDAYDGLMELANATNVKNNIIHRDVIDAMMRQPFSNGTLPFKNKAISDGSVINAVDYDLGANGFAYYDMDTANYRLNAPKMNVGNRGHTYRNDGVDIRKEEVEAEAYYVSDIEEGEWLQYSFTDVQKGTYVIELTIASTNDSGRISIGNASNRRLFENAVVPNSGGLHNWKSFSAGKITVAGKQVLRIYFVKGGFNLKSIKFIAAKK